jgi:CheY-like chemotaxis protein
LRVPLKICPGRPSSRGVKILIIDDARWQRSQLTRILSGAGHEVIQAANGREGLEKLSDEPTAIVCDLLMPELDGFGVLEELRQRGSSIPVVIASADIQKTSRARCAELGARQFVSKPYTAETILHAISQALSPDEPSAC